MQSASCPLLLTEHAMEHADRLDRLVFHVSLLAFIVACLPWP